MAMISIDAVVGTDARRRLGGLDRMLVVWTVVVVPVVAVVGAALRCGCANEGKGAFVGVVAGRVAPGSFRGGSCFSRGGTVGSEE
jgi:hypothetical protein